ncbi:MAG: dTMP kinase [Bacteroidetes bacterium]|nr:dTMP kinase [Bacteroidota bacterium]
MFITFEGIDFSGKSTQISLLTDRLRLQGEEVLVVREPGGTIISEKIRELLLDRSHVAMDAVTEFLLFSAARSQLLREIIAPVLTSGTTVIADRFHDSSTAYQGFGRGLDIEAVNSVHRLATHGIEPDLTFFIDISVDESYRRRALQGREIDRMEALDASFFQAVRTGYQAIATEAPSRFITINGMQPIEDIAKAIWDAVSSRRPSRKESS